MATASPSCRTSSGPTPSPYNSSALLVLPPPALSSILNSNEATTRSPLHELEKRNKAATPSAQQQLKFLAESATRPDSMLAESGALKLVEQPGRDLVKIGRAWRPSGRDSMSTRYQTAAAALQHTGSASLALAEGQTQ